MPELSEKMQLAAAQHKPQHLEQFQNAVDDIHSYTQTKYIDFGFSHSSALVDGQNEAAEKIQSVTGSVVNDQAQLTSSFLDILKLKVNGRIADIQQLVAEHHEHLATA